jgi:hypothetical protein
MLRTYLRMFMGLPFSDQYLPQFNIIFSKFTSTTQPDPVSINFIANLLCKRPSSRPSLHGFDSAMTFEGDAHATPNGRAQIFDFIVQRVEKFPWFASFDGPFSKFPPTERFPFCGRLF